MAEPGLTPFFDKMMEYNLIDSNIFAFYMSMNPMNDDSELTFGGYDTSRFVGSLKWHPVIDQLFWSLNLEDVRIGDQSLGICQDRQCFATPDSGTSLSTMPSWALSIFDDATYE